MSIKLEKVIFLLPVPPHPPQPHTIPWLAGCILPEALNVGWGRLSASLPQGNKTMWVSCGEQRECDKEGGRVLAGLPYFAFS